MRDVIVYDNGEIALDISVEQESIWLTQKQMATLFEKDVRTINDHIKAIYKDEELEENATIRKIRIVQKEGSREVSRDVNHYNLDMVISVGYRVSSKKATKFRQWATKILKEYITNGYAINSQKITVDRFLHLEESVSSLEQEVKGLKEDKEQTRLTQGVFYNGQIYDAYVLINDILKLAEREVVLIDNYIDESVLTLFSKYPELHYTIITKSTSKQLTLDIKKYNAQYNNLTIQKSNRYHDRFLLLDGVRAYHIGASLKDLGKKVFAFSQIDREMLRLDDE